MVIIPCGITASLSADDRATLYTFCKEVESELSNAGVRVSGDYRENYSPGWKFNHWELKVMLTQGNGMEILSVIFLQGVPIRLEVGPRDMKEGKVVTVRRDNGAKGSFLKADAAKSTKEMLEQIQKDMYDR